MDPSGPRYSPSNAPSADTLNFAVHNIHVIKNPDRKSAGSIPFEPALLLLLGLKCPLSRSFAHGSQHLEDAFHDGFGYTFVLLAYVA